MIIENTVSLRLCSTRCKMFSRAVSQGTGMDFHRPSRTKMKEYFYIMFFSVSLSVCVCPCRSRFIFRASATHSCTSSRSHEITDAQAKNKNKLKFNEAPEERAYPRYSSMFHADKKSNPSLPGKGFACCVSPSTMVMLSLVSYAGHSGKPLPFGLPVAAKLAQ